MKISVLLIHHLQHAQDVQNEIFDTNILLGGNLIRFLKIQKLNVNMNKKTMEFHHTYQRQCNDLLFRNPV